jgi:NAD(P)-dependent dehydrogenase (short-subunit alcohol dehydrogenase family)
VAWALIRQSRAGGRSRGRRHWPEYGHAKAVGQSNDLQAVKLDVTSRADAEATVRAAVDRFGSIYVLVNNAASFYAGYFEELTPEQFERQLAVSLIGPMNVTRAVLPVMRKQHSGLHYFDLLVSGPRRRASSSLAPTPRRRAGWMESLHAEVAPFGITTTIVNLGSFARNSSRSSRRTTPSHPSRTTTSAERSSSSFGKPRMACNPVIRPSLRERPSPLRTRSHRRAASSLAPTPLPLRSRRSDLKALIDAERDLSTSLDFDEVGSTRHGT